MKTTATILHDQGLFDSYDSANEVAKDYSLTEFNKKRRLDLDPIIDDIVRKWEIGSTDIIQGFYPNPQLKKRIDVKYKTSTNPLIFVSDCTYLRDGPWTIDVGNVKLHQTSGAPWVLFKNQNYFNSFGCSPPQNFLGSIENEIDIVFIIWIQNPSSTFILCIVLFFL